MSDFDYLQRIAIGQYMPGHSVIHRLDPRARILVFSVILLAIAVSPNLLGVFVGLGIVLIGIFLAQMPLRFALRSLLSPMPFLILLAIIQIFITPPGSTLILLQWRFLHISVAGLLAAFKMILRFAVLILGLSLSSYTISSSELIAGLRGLLKPFARFGLPVNDLILMSQVTLRFVPLLALSAERIAKAQASRGAEWGTGRGNLLQRAREVIPLIVPLFLTTLRRAENLALAMDARGYGASPNPTSRVILHLTPKDYIAVLIALSATFAVLFMH